MAGLFAAHRAFAQPSRAGGTTLAPEQFGARGDGLADDGPAINAALAALGRSGGGTLLLSPGRHFRTSGPLVCNGSDIEVVATQAVIVGSLRNTPDWFRPARRGGQSPLIALTGDRCRIRGGRWIVNDDTAEGRSWLFEIIGRKCSLSDGATFEKEPEAGGYQGYVRRTATGFLMSGCRTRGSNGIFVEASNATLTNNVFKGRRVGGDDAIAIKATHGFTRSVRITGNNFSNLAYFCSIGSEVGTRGRNDPSYSNGVADVEVTGNSGRDCTGILFVKPGAVEPYDWRDGTVENVLIANNSLEDLSGTKFERGIALTPARGARIRGVRGQNNLIVARASAGPGRKVGAVDIFILDYRTLSPGSREPSVSDVDLSVSFRDPYEGSSAAVGAPVTSIVAIEKSSVNHGRVERVLLDVEGVGSSGAGFFVGRGLDNAVELRRAVLWQVNRTGGESQGGVFVRSRVRILSTDVRPASGPPFRQE